jgi:AcrR family transcriptional regulator
VEASEAVLDRAERSRRAILDAAAPIFAEHGYSGASLNQIILASGLTKGGFYFHFPSKQALALAVLADRTERWYAIVMAEVSQYPRAVDRLFAFPKVMARGTIQQLAPGNLRKLIDELSSDPDLRDDVCGSVAQAIEVVAGQFREAQAEGDIRADVDPVAMAEIAVGAFTGMQTITEQLGDGELERRIDTLVEFVRAALVVRPEEGGTP